MDIRNADFASNLSATLRNLRATQAFSDVLLATHDDHVEKAHRFVLVEASPFFRKTLLANSNVGGNYSANSQVIFMRGVKKKELGLLLDYLYTGSVSVAQEDVDAFMSLVASLNINLTGERTDDAVGNHVQNGEAVNIIIPELSADHGISIRDDLMAEFQADNLNFVVKQEDGDGVDPLDSSDPGSNAEALSLQELMSTKVKPAHGGGLVCMVCDGKASTTGNMRRHMRTAHLDSTDIFRCPVAVCAKRFSRKTVFCAHIKSLHKLAMNSEEIQQCVVKED